MRRIMGLSAVAGIAGMACAAIAAEMTGVVEQIDEMAGNIVVTDAAADQARVFAVSETNTAGATLEDLQEGDQVKIFYADSDTESGKPIEAMQIDKIED